MLAFGTCLVIIKEKENAKDNKNFYNNLNLLILKIIKNPPIVIVTIVNIIIIIKIKSKYDYFLL